MGGIILEPERRGHRCDLPWRGLICTGYPDGTLFCCKECQARWIARSDSFDGYQTWRKLRWWQRTAHRRLDEAQQA